jgi:hypothetical protein
MPRYYYESYKDLYKAAQSKGKYKMFLFDVKDSRIHVARDKKNFCIKIIDFIDEVTFELLELEKKIGHKILHRELEREDLKDQDKIIDDKVILLRNQVRGRFNVAGRIDQYNPLFWQGDMIHFIINRDSISDSEIMKIFQRNKDKFIPDYDLHLKSAYYETDVWLKSSEEFSRVYCVPVLEYLAKASKKLLVTPTELKEKSENITKEHQTKEKEL